VYPGNGHPSKVQVPDELPYFLINVLRIPRLVSDCTLVVHYYSCGTDVLDAEVRDLSNIWQKVIPLYVKHALATPFNGATFLCVNHTGALLFASRCDALFLVVVFHGRQKLVRRDGEDSVGLVFRPVLALPLAANNKIRVICDEHGVLEYKTLNLQRVSRNSYHSYSI
jgi:hypothetical protein